MELKGICTAVADLNARLEYRNRAAPVSFCGNRSSSVLFALDFLWLYSTLQWDAVFNGDGYSDD